GFSRRFSGGFGSGFRGPTAVNAVDDRLWRRVGDAGLLVGRVLVPLRCSASPPTTVRRITVQRKKLGYGLLRPVVAAVIAHGALPGTLDNPGQHAPGTVLVP